MPLCQMTVLAIDYRLRAYRDGYIETTANFHAEKIGGRYSHNVEAMTVQ